MSSLCCTTPLLDEHITILKTSLKKYVLAMQGWSYTGCDELSSQAKEEDAVFDG